MDAPLPTNLSTRTENQDGGEVLRISGEIDLSTAPRLAAALDRALVPGLPLIADMTDVGFIDSAGTRVLAVADRTAADQGGRLLIVPSDFVARVLEIAGFGPVFHTCADLPEAQAAARGLLSRRAAATPPAPSV